MYRIVCFEISVLNIAAVSYWVSSSVCRLYTLSLLSYLQDYLVFLDKREAHTHLLTCLFNRLLILV